MRTMNLSSSLFAHFARRNDLNDEADRTPQERSIDDLTIRPPVLKPETGITYGELAFFVILVVFLVNCLLRLL